LDWSSLEVQAVFKKYWTTNPSYLNAKSAKCDTVPWMPMDSNTLPMFEKLGYLEVLHEDLEAFVNGGEIHPIFRASNFIIDPNLPGKNEMYRAMAPALRVVSNFIVSKEFSQWWLQVRYGKRSETCPVFLESSYLEDPLQAHYLLQQEFLEISEYIKFTWLAEDPMGNADGITAATIPMLLRYLENKEVSNKLGNMAARVSNPTIALSIRYYRYLLVSKKMTPGENLRFQFTLARLLLHELGHAFFAYFQGVGPECRVYESDAFEEIGFSLENALFGAILQCEGLDIEIRENSIGPIMASRFKDLFPIQKPIASFVTMEWVHQWFRLRTWAHIPELKATGKLQVMTTDGFPRLFQIIRWSGSGKLIPSLEYNLTKEEALRMSKSRPPKKQSQAVRDARKFGSVGSWYEKVWSKDAVKA
ncbi:hypothetical protein K505DRAFT_218533, partial [Melanomma pulvis-pyrius CBS 109.77]